MGQTTQEGIMETQEIDRICAWCDEVMGTKEVPADSTGEATHGICKECQREFMGDLNDEFINDGTESASMEKAAHAATV